MIAFRGTGLNVADGYLIVRLNQVNVGVVGVALNGSGLQQRYARLLLLQQPGVHKLIGKERAILVIKYGAQLQGARSLID